MSSGILESRGREGRRRREKEGRRRREERGREERGREREKGGREEGRGEKGGRGNTYHVNDVRWMRGGCRVGEVHVQKTY